MRQYLLVVLFGFTGRVFMDLFEILENVSLDQRVKTAAPLTAALQLLAQKPHLLQRRHLYVGPDDELVQRLVILAAQAFQKPNCGLVPASFHNSLPDERVPAEN